MKNLLNKINKNSLYLGLKKGYSVATLPKKLDIIYNYMFIRILRFIGGVCLLLVLTQNHSLFPMFLQIPIIIMGFLQSVQILIIFLIKFIYGIYTLKYKPEEFEVRNSPLNAYATHIAKILYCAKVGCVITGGAATTVAAGASFDLVLEAAGRPKVFVPMLGSIYRSVFGEYPTINETRIKGFVSNVAPKEDISITEMIRKYQSLNDSDRLEFLAEINNELLKKK